MTRKFTCYLMMRWILLTYCTCSGDNNSRSTRNGSTKSCSSSSAYTYWGDFSDDIFLVLGAKAVVKQAVVLHHSHPRKACYYEVDVGRQVLSTNLDYSVAGRRARGRIRVVACSIQVVDACICLSWGMLGFASTSNLLERWAVVPGLELYRASTAL